MKNTMIFLSVVFLFLGTGSKVFSQEVHSRLPLTADSLATGNGKDVFKSFFQLAFNRFTSTDKEISFSSNPFAVMSRMNPDMLIDKNYVRYNTLRRLNFSFSAKLDSAYRFNGFSSGIKYALINQRDETVSSFFVSEAYNANKEFNQLFSSLSGYVSIVAATDREKAVEIDNQINKLFEGTVVFSGVDTGLQKEIKRIATANNATHFLNLLAADPDLNIHKMEMDRYEEAKALFQQRWLWTVSLSDTTYKDQFLFSNIVLSTELLKGISNPKQVVSAEINVQGALNFLDNNLAAGRDLGRRFANVEPGLNIVFKNRETQYPWAEFKLSGNYIHSFTGRYEGERKDSLTMNATFRLRIMNDIWIPLEIKYDPRSGNVFGFLNVRANFEGIAGLIGKTHND